jgi:hypothetical protein
MAEIRWEDPAPPKKGKRGSWIERLTPLMDHPKRWARIHESPTIDAAYKMTTDLNRRRIVIPAGQWEFAARKADDGGGAVFARYLGEDDA